MKLASLQHFLLVLGALGVAGLIIWPGCATPPLPAKRTPLSNLRTKDFKEAARQKPTRAELEAQLGAPVEFFEDLNVACYRLNRVSRRRLWLFLGVLPIAAPRDADRTEVALVQFDEAGLISRHGLKETWATSALLGDSPGAGPETDHKHLVRLEEWLRKDLRRMAERWLAEPEPAKSSRP